MNKSNYKRTKTAGPPTRSDRVRRANPLGDDLPVLQLLAVEFSVLVQIPAPWVNNIAE